MNNYANPDEYWESRLEDQFDLVGVGHAWLGPNYNSVLYRTRLERLEGLFNEFDIDLAKARVLEIGCGTGFYTHYFAKNGVQEYLGLDITQVSVSRLQADFQHYTFRQLDVSNPNFELDAKYDLVLIADVFFHIVDDDAFAQALENIAGVLQPTGKVIISDILPPNSFRLADHVHLRSREHYQHCLILFNLVILGTKPIFATLHPPAIKQGGFGWSSYARVWNLMWPFVRLALIDRFLPELLAWFDRRFALGWWGMTAPASKWLLISHKDDPKFS